MEQLAGVFLALGLAFFGERQENKIFTLGSAGMFFWLAFDSVEPIIMVTLLGVGIYQLYKTFMK
jgi:hypothetical protein